MKDIATQIAQELAAGNSATLFSAEHFLTHCRSCGELNDIAKHEVLRLAAEFCESRFRFPNVHGRAEE